MRALLTIERLILTEIFDDIDGVLATALSCILDEIGSANDADDNTCGEFAFVVTIKVVSVPPIPQLPDAPFHSAPVHMLIVTLPVPVIVCVISADVVDTFPKL